MPTEKRAQVKIDLRDKNGKKTKLDFEFNPLMDRWVVTIRQGANDCTEYAWTATEFSESIRRWLVAQK